MKTQNKHKQKTIDINPVSRKTNEEIDEDEFGNLIIGGEISVEPFNEDKPSLKNNLANTNEARED